MRTPRSAPRPTRGGRCATGSSSAMAQPDGRQRSWRGGGGGLGPWLPAAHRPHPSVPGVRRGRAAVRQDCAGASAAHRRLAGHAVGRGRHGRCHGKPRRRPCRRCSRGSRPSPALRHRRDPRPGGAAQPRRFSRRCVSHRHEAGLLYLVNDPAADPVVNAPGRRRRSRFFTRRTGHARRVLRGRPRHRAAPRPRADRHASGGTEQWHSCWRSNCRVPAPRHCRFGPEAPAGAGSFG